MITVLGIDPGLRGAFSLLDGESVIVEPMPLAFGELDLAELNRLFRHYADGITMAYLERAGMRPLQSAQSTFACGRGFGVIEGMLAALHIPTTLVSPSVWSAFYDHGVTEKDKDKRYKLIKLARRRIAADLYPGIDLRRNSKCTIADEGIVDSLLLADYGLKLKQGRNPYDN